MLDQVLAAGSFRQHGGQEFTRGVELMKPGKDDLLDLLSLVLLSHQIPTQDFEPALPLPALSEKSLVEAEGCKIDLAQEWLS
jgi:hypothetical protein